MPSCRICYSFFAVYFKCTCSSSRKQICGIITGSYLKVALDIRQASLLHAYVISALFTNNEFVGLK
nr:MAG TPA: Colipase [Caudoviricetes sp.]